MQMPLEPEKLINIAHKRVKTKYPYLNFIHDDLASVFILFAVEACKRLNPAMSTKQKITYILLKSDYGTFDTVYGRGRKIGESEFYKKHCQLDFDIPSEETFNSEDFEQELRNIFKLFTKTEEKIFILLLCGHKSEEIINIVNISSRNSYNSIICKARKKVLAYLKK